MSLPSQARASRRTLAMLIAAALLAALVPSLSPAANAAPGPVGQAGELRPVPRPTVEGPLPGTAPGDPTSPDIEDTYPFFSTYVDLEGNGYVEEEFLVSGSADAYSTTGELVGEDVPYETRMVVRRPVHQRDFNGTVLVEWQNVSAGYDLDALWQPEHVMRSGYAWVGVSAQRVGVDQLREWSPARYGTLDVTGGGRFNADEMSYDIFAQAAKALTTPRRGHHPSGSAGADADATSATGGGRDGGGGRDEVRPMGRLRVDTVIGTGASQSAGRMTIYYNSVLPQVEPVFDGYGFIVGNAPTREGPEPIFHVLSETDVRSPVWPRQDSDVYRRWEVAGSAHSGWTGQEYRMPISERDLGAPPSYECESPPFSRVPLAHVVSAAYDHLVRWVEEGEAPPTAEPLEFNADGTKARDEHGLALGGIRLSQVEVPTALNTGDNAGETFCRLFGTHVPFDEAKLDQLYPDHGRYVSAVARVDHRNVRAGYIVQADAWRNLIEAVHSDIGR
jgi:hypothetical protein